MISNLLRRLALRRRASPSQKLAATLRPDPTAYQRHLARRERYEAEKKTDPMQRFLRFTSDPLIMAVLTPRHNITLAKKAKIRNELIRRRGVDCHFCGEPCKTVGDVRNDPDFATIEHIVPVIYGGGWDIDNLTLAHRRCNQSDAKARGFDKIGNLVHSTAKSLATAAVGGDV